MGRIDARADRCRLGRMQSDKVATWSNIVVREQDGVKRAARGVSTRS